MSGRVFAVTSEPMPPFARPETNYEWSFGSAQLPKVRIDASRLPANEAVVQREIDFLRLTRPVPSPPKRPITKKNSGIRKAGSC